MTFNPTPHVPCKHGAPMGRLSSPLAAFDASQPVNLVRLKWVDGDYDEGGAYWGNGNGGNVYCIGQSDGDGYWYHYFRAPSVAGSMGYLREHGLHVANETLAEVSFEAMLDAYIACALWSSNDESTEDSGAPLDDNYGPEDLDPDLLEKMREDCQVFIRKAPASLGKQETIDWTRLGHDFWLTRNGHGAGFWDGDWPEELGRELTALRERFGEHHLYVDNDGKIHGD